MVSVSKILHKHVIDICIHGVSNQLLEDLVDYFLGGSSGILQFKWHHLIIVDSPIGDKYHLIFIWWMHFDPIVSGVGIHKAE